jgi:hypothetical protein
MLITTLFNQVDLCQKSKDIFHTLAVGELPTPLHTKIPAWPSFNFPALFHFPYITVPLRYPLPFFTSPPPVYRSARKSRLDMALNKLEKGDSDTGADNITTISANATFPQFRHLPAEIQIAI